MQLVSIENLMLASFTIPLLFGGVSGCLLSLLAMGFWKVYRNRHKDDKETIENPEVLFCFMLLATFSLGVFLTYILFTIG
jgi:hypothetical protein